MLITVCRVSNNIMRTYRIIIKPGCFSDFYLLSTKKHMDNLISSPLNYCRNLSKVNEFVPLFFVASEFSLWKVKLTCRDVWFPLTLTKIAIFYLEHLHLTQRVMIGLQCFRHQILVSPEVCVCVLVNVIWCCPSLWN